MAIPGVKYDDGSIGFSANCFPVRTLMRQNEDGMPLTIILFR